MHLFVITNKDVMKINADVNAKNWLTKEYGIKDLFGIQVIVNVNTINHGEYFDYKNRKCRKTLVDKLVEKCEENVDVKKLHATELHSSKMIYKSTLNDF